MIPVVIKSFTKRNFNISRFLTCSAVDFSLKQTTIRDSTGGFPAKRCLRNERRNSVLMACCLSDLGSASDWSYHEGNWFQTNRHQYGISAVVQRASLGSLRKDDGDGNENGKKQ